MYISSCLCALYDIQCEIVFFCSCLGLAFPMVSSVARSLLSKQVRSLWKAYTMCSTHSCMLAHVFRKATLLHVLGFFAIYHVTQKEKPCWVWQLCSSSAISLGNLGGMEPMKLDTILFCYTVFGAPSYESESVMPILCSGSTVFIGKSLFRPGWPRGCCTLLRCAPTHRFVQLLHCILVDITKYTCPNPSSPSYSFS